MDINGDMIRGHIDTIILLSLVDGDKDTNEIRKNIEDRSDNKFSVKQGTFYSAMQRLVKQNLIREYRSSATDGIRRKYFSLTEKGKKSVETNKSEWIKSKEVIDTLVDTVVEKQQESPILSAENFPIPPVDPYLSRKEAENDAIYDENTANDEDLLKNFNEKLTDMLGEIIKNDASNDEADEEKPTEILPENFVASDEQSLKTPEITEEDVENAVNESIAEVKNAVDETTEKPSESVVCQSEVRDYPFEIKDRSLYTKKDEILPNTDETVQEVIDKPSEETDEKLSNIADIIDKNDDDITNTAQSDENTVSNRFFADDEQVSYKTEPETNENDEADDLLSVEDGTTLNKREYKSILASLFPKEKPEEQPAAYIEKENIDKFADAEDAPRAARPAASDDYRENNPIAYNEEVEPETISTSVAERKRDYSKDYSESEGSNDFSDLYAMAQREGFKIRTSFNTNKASGDRILSSKLNFHASLLSYLLLFIEMIILNFTLGPIVGWSSAVKLIIVFATALFPVTTCVIYNVNRKRAVKSISPFKDVFEIALIVTFQITIIILCVALFASVDFGDFKSVSQFVLIPFVFALNIPLFFAIKYALYGTGKYFAVTKKK